MEFSGILPGKGSGITRVLDGERLALAEEKTAELIAHMQPTLQSEVRRHAVANYVQQLIEKNFSCKVYRTGSMPFKTYIPDGDIDLTACGKGMEHQVPSVFELLQNEENNANGEFHIKDVRLIGARVMVIKCSVEDIMVDITCNRVNGLSTLCFLDEMDDLIKQDHLFKRSIILIKAWCYYESRLLGAAYSLLSTYTLEILILYIFHIFNSSFVGPLEVLYRFLEFFSNFDWDKFFLSLWGPIPATSRMIGSAEPPRRDNGALLLSKDFIDSCRTKYGVYAGDRGGEWVGFNHISFSIVDPLSIQNNLGISVSKGSSARICCAFTLGAKTLAHVLHCPKENLIAELNKFFVNTLERLHDIRLLGAPYLSMQPLQPSNAASQEESNNFGSVSNIRRDNDRLKLSAGRAFNAEDTLSFQGPTSQIIRTIRQDSGNSVETTSTNMAASHIPSQINIRSQSNSVVSGQIDLSNSPRVSFETGKNPKNSTPVDPLNDHGRKIRFQLTRSNSSPELIDSSAELSFQRRETEVLEIGNNQTAQARFDCVVQRKDIVYEVSGCHSGGSFDDPSYLKHISSHKNFESVRLDGISIDNQDAGCTSDEVDLASASDAIKLQQLDQGEQDLINTMASSSVHYSSGQVQVPMHHFVSAHLAMSLALSQATLNCAQKSSEDKFSGSIQVANQCWTPTIKFPCILIAPQFPHSYPTSGLNSNSEESGNENGSFAQTHQDDSDKVWREQVAGPSRGFDLETGGLHMTHSADETQINPSDSDSSHIPGHHRLTRENGEPERYDISSPQYKTSSKNDCIDRTGSLRFFSACQNGLSRHNPFSGSSWDGSSRKPSKSVRDKRGRKPDADKTSLRDKMKNGWRHEDSSHHLSSQADNEASPRASIHQFPGYGTPDISGSNSMLSISPLIVNRSQQKVVNTSGVVPFAFYPTGPAVPFLAMLPVYNFPSDKGKSNRSTAQLDNSEGFLQVQTSLCDHICDSREQLDQLEPHPSSSDLRSSISIEEHKSDILNSHFASHWDSLQSSQFSQYTSYQGSFVYHSSVVPPVYVQGHYPWDGPGRPLSASENLFPQVTNCGPRLFPVIVLRPVPSRNSSLLPHFGGQIPRCRNGTGTSLSFLGRKPSNSKHQRANKNFVQGDDRPDTERSWINSKSRAARCRHGRTQAERPRSQSDRSSAADYQADRTWNSERNGPSPSYHSSDNSFQSTKSNGSASVAYDMYPLPPLNSNGATQTGASLPSVPMLCQCNQGVGHGFPAEEGLEFGLLAPHQFSGTNTLQPPSGVSSPKGTHVHRQRTYLGGSLCSTPDQSSPPPIQRKQ